ncbi:MAG: AzlD domain-containing protein [Erysipelotrichaceae bacterium]|nr:AzlD domain-containing protein [Erysipelotrichaceae bacterium]
MNRTYIYIFIMALVTYLIRAIPITFIHKDIKNLFIKSFLYYVPYVTLSAMVFPSILSSTGNTYTALAGFIVALVLAYKECSLTTVAFVACLAAFITGFWI